MALQHMPVSHLFHISRNRLQLIEWQLIQVYNDRCVLEGSLLSLLQGLSTFRFGQLYHTTVRAKMQ